MGSSPTTGTKSTVYTGNDEKLAETIANQLTTSGCTVIHKKINVLLIN